MCNKRALIWVAFFDYAFVALADCVCGLVTNQLQKVGQGFFEKLLSQFVESTPTN